MKNNTTELVFILDRSGSMHGLEKDTIGGFNSMLQRQKGLAGRAYVTTVLFSSSHEIIHDRLDITKVKEMSDRDYCPGGCTALIDALGSAIKHIVNIHRYARKEDVPEKTVFVIITDGLENASRIFSAAQVKKMIEHEKNKYGWEFLFLGANIDAVETAASYGIGADRAVEYCSDGQGTAVNYSTVSVAVENLRTGKCLNADWMLPIVQDKKSRE